MSGRLLLDTNVIIALFAEDSNLHELLAGAQEVFAPVVAIGELYFGAYKSVKVKENLAVIDEFALSSTVLACDAGTAIKIWRDQEPPERKGSTDSGERHVGCCNCSATWSWIGEQGCAF